MWLRWLAIAVVVAAGTGGAAAQSLDDLQVPSMPAFTVLDIAPIAIERPNTPQALGLGLLSAARTGGLPDSYAVEVAPYWLTPRPLLTFEDRYNPTFLQGLAQSLAFSMATAPAGQEAGDSMRLGVGFRALLLPGRPAPGPAKAALNEAQRRVNDLDQAIDTEQNDVVAASLIAQRDSLLELTRTLAKDVAAEYDQSAVRNLRWELAGGVGSLFPQAEFAGGRVTAVSLWTTVSFKPAKSDFDFVALGRYQHLNLGTLPATEDSDRVDGEQDVFDLGGRLLWALGTFELSGELVGRLALDVTSRAPGSAQIQYDNTFRATVALAYQASDDIALRWAFGRGFVLEGTDAATLIADLGVHLGLGPKLHLPY